MMLFILLLCCAFVQANTVFENISCSLSSPSRTLFIQNLPTGFEFNAPYTVVLLSNDTVALSYSTFEIGAIFNRSNDSICHPTNTSVPSGFHRVEFILKLEKNSTKIPCIQLNLLDYFTSTKIKIAHLCTNSSTDKIIDNDDKYDIQSYMRTINTTDVALLDNFNWLIFGRRVQQSWYTHEGMRLSRECDAAEDGRVAIFNNPRGKRRLISRPIDISNISLLYMRVGSGTCPPPGPTDPPLQLLITTDCLNYTDWNVVYSQRVLPGIEYVTVPLSLNNLTNSSTACLKIEQNGEKFSGGGSWFIDDFLLIRSRLQNDYFFDTFQMMRTGNWYRLTGGQLMTCDERMSMVFEPNADIRTELGATTIDLSLSSKMDYSRDVLFHLSKDSPIDWTKWNATGFLDLNKTCADEDVITFNGENYRQLCSPIIELGLIDSIRVTLSAEPCLKRNKHVPTPGAVIFLAVIYNGSTVGYSRTIRRIALREIQSSYKTFYGRLNEFHHGTTSFGRICLSQYHQSAGKNVDVWSLRDFTAFPLFPLNITHYIQLGVNPKCSSSSSTNAGLSSQAVNVDYSADFGKNWYGLFQPCYLNSACSHHVQHVYSSKIVLPSSGWHRVTLPLPMSILQQEYTRFRISASPYSVSAYSPSDPWAIDQVFIGRCFRGCSGHGWCQLNLCRCDRGFSGEFCEISNETLFNNGSFLMNNNEDQTGLLTYQAGLLSYQCDIISRGKALVFSKAGFRFLRISNVNGSSPKLLQFTLRLGSSNVQCLGTSKTDLDRDRKSILLLSSCSNGVHWRIVDRFSVSDLLAPDFRTISRVVFREKLDSENCLIEWRQMAHGGDDQDVWAIDDIIIRDVSVIKSIKRPYHVKTFQTKLMYIRPGYILSFRLDAINHKDPNIMLDVDDIRLRVNSTEIDLSKAVEIFSYESENSSHTIIIALPKTIWFKDVVLNLNVTATKKFAMSSIYIGVQCENNCWLKGVCYEGICLDEPKKSTKQLIDLSLDENDLIKHRINAVDDEVLLPFVDSTDISAVHFQTIAGNLRKNNLLLECSPNGGMKWFELGLWLEEKQNFIRDHYVSLPSSCQSKQTLFRWSKSSVQLRNVAFVKSQTQYSFMDKFQIIDPSKWLYPTYVINSSELTTNKIRLIPQTKSIYQLITTSITVKQKDYVIMIDSDLNRNHTHLQIAYSLDNLTWHELIDTRSFEQKMNRFGRQIPSELYRRSILIRIQSDHSFTLNYVYVGPQCPANCYGFGKCLWDNQRTVCQCDKNYTSEGNCLPGSQSLLSSIYETFTNKLNASLWTTSSNAHVTNRCHNRQSTTTPYLCFSSNSHNQRSYAMIGPFKTIKYVIFKFGALYTNATNCLNEILFQYSYDNGIQWFTKDKWIEESDQPCLVWNLRSISIRTKEDDELWFENNLHVEQKNKIDYVAQTWEFATIQPSSMIQFDLQMFPRKQFNDTDWQLLLEISSDVSHGWFNWMPLILPCNQTTRYCEDQIASTGSIFLAELHLKRRNVTIPVPENYANQDVRFRWSASKSDARFIIHNVYVGADCPWFCSGHGICQSNDGCLCDHGYASPYCAPDSSIGMDDDSLLSVELTENLSVWSQTWGHEKCSVSDPRRVFSQAGSRGLISPELSLKNVQLIRIQLDICSNRSEIFLDPIYIQMSTNNGILWTTLTTIVYRPEQPYQPWLVVIPDDEILQVHLVRIRLFQRVLTKWSSNWILYKFELIPRVLPTRWISNCSSTSDICDYKDYIFPLEVYSTIDIQLNETSFLTFQLNSHPCMTNPLGAPNRSQFDLEFSTDYGQTWSSIDRPSTVASRTNDIIINQPLRPIKNRFYLPVHAYRSLSKSIRIRWLAHNATIATRRQITNVTIRSECEILCELQICNEKCRCAEKNNCSVPSTKTTFFERFNGSSPSLSDFILLPPLNLVSTRFIELDIHMTCQQNYSILSLEYSRNMGLSWQLFKHYILPINDSYILHEDFHDDMKYDSVLIRLVILSSMSECVHIEHIAVSGANNPQEMIYGKFDQLTNFEPKFFVSFGDGIFNGTYLMFPFSNQSDSMSNEIITDDLLILKKSLYVQLSVASLAMNQCISVQLSFSSDYGHTWQVIEHDDVLLDDEQSKIQTWKLASMMIGSNQVRFRIRFNEEQISTNEEVFLIAISELYIGSNCSNSCNDHGMCLNNSRCRCDSGWTNSDCSLSLKRFPNELDILKHKYYRSSGDVQHTKCGTVFDKMCKREMETNYIDVNHEHTYVDIELDDQCVTKAVTRKNNDGWIRLQYREINVHQWNTLHIFKGLRLNVTKLLPSIILQLRLIQDVPMTSRSAWSIERFHVSHIHSYLQWSSLEDQNQTLSWNSTFLTFTKTKTQIVYETKDVYFKSDYILQIEFNCTNLILEYSLDFGSKWSEISNDNELQFVPIQFRSGNVTINRLTFPFHLLLNRNRSIRFRLRFSSKCSYHPLIYFYIGNKCPMNCFGNAHCNKGQCQMTNSVLPVVDFRETFEKDFSGMNWLHLEPYELESNQIKWTTTNRQAITQPIDLRLIRAIKWTYNFDEIQKACSNSIYFLISTDGALTWSILYKFDFSSKNSNTSIEITIELESINTKYQTGQFRWYEPSSPKCANVSWSLSRIISIKSINIYFLTDYFYTISSSRANWESINGASLAQPDLCNNNLPTLVFREPSFSITTVPILIQSYYVLVFQFNTECDRNTNAKTHRCHNVTTSIEYRTESSAKWIKLGDMSDLACRTSLLNGGYFNMHTLKLPTETYSR
ncbi:unnamed protein product [Adineta ricciae]|uniref:Reelin n=1 Tax=Adineta ricciae TaxID=249248 RepID=A0A814C6X1_ADIRI|nr:unnamed protein product [Adineta ricciae]